MQTISSLMSILVAIEILALPILLIVWLLRKAKKKPKMKWVKWFWVSFALFLTIGMITNPATWCKHEYKMVESKEASCTESGYEKYHCELCGSDKTNAIKELGHSMVDVRRVEPTDDKDGEYVQRCTRCGYEKTKVLPMPKKSTDRKTGSSESKKPEPTTEPVDTSTNEQMVSKNSTESTKETETEYPKAVKSYAKKNKISEELAYSFQQALSETEYADKYNDFWFDYLDDHAYGARYTAWYDSGDSKISLLVYETRGVVWSIYDRSDGGRSLIYQNDTEVTEVEQPTDGSIRIVEGVLGEYGREVTIPSKTYGEYTYIQYIVPYGTYTVKNELKLVTVFVVADEDSEDCRESVQMTDTGETAQITVEEGTHIELSAKAEILLIPTEQDTSKMQQEFLELGYSETEAKHIESVLDEVGIKKCKVLMADEETSDGMRVVACVFNDSVDGYFSTLHGKVAVIGGIKDFWYDSERGGVLSQISES